MTVYSMSSYVTFSTRIMFKQKWVLQVNVTCQTDILFTWHSRKITLMQWRCLFYKQSLEYKIDMRILPVLQVTCEMGSWHFSCFKISNSYIHTMFVCGADIFSLTNMFVAQEYCPGYTFPLDLWYFLSLKCKTMEYAHY